MANNNKNYPSDKTCEAGCYDVNKMQKDIIIDKLKENGCRITKQRIIIIDIILENECSCCKEIYYLANKSDDKIGAATVYRMINIMEEIGAISRRNMYRVVDSSEVMKNEEVCTVELEDGTIYQFDEEKWLSVFREGMINCGLMKNQRIVSVKIQQ